MTLFMDSHPSMNYKHPLPEESDAMNECSMAAVTSITPSPAHVLTARSHIEDLANPLGSMRLQETLLWGCFQKGGTQRKQRSPPR